MLEKLPLPQAPQRFKQYVATISVSLGAFCGGTLLSWTSAALVHIIPETDSNVINANLSSQSVTNTSNDIPGFSITHEEEALVGSMLTVGALLSAIPTGYLADKFGRKNVILALIIPFLLNWILITFATNVETVLVARFCAGIGLGGICVAAPMYIGEIAEASHRGMFGSFFQMFLCCGVLFTCIIGSFTNWVGLALVLGALPVIFGIFFVFMPETPVYLVKKIKIDEAEKNLKELRGGSDVSAELKNIQKEISEAQAKTGNIKDIITNKGNMRAILSSVSIAAFQQLSGINAIIFYTAPIFTAAGSSMAPSVAAIIINSVQVIVSYISILIVEKAPRKFYLSISSVGMMLCLTALGMFFHLKSLEIEIINNVGFIPITSIVLFMVSFALGYGPVPWMLMSEIFSPEIKGIASGIAILTSWIFAFIVTLCFPIMSRSLGDHVTFYMFAAIMAIGTVFVHFIVPETRGKSSMEIQEMLNN